MDARRIGAVLVLLSTAVFAEAQLAESTLDEIVVTATRIGQPQSEVPGSVTVITASELETRGVTTVAQAIETTAGVVVSDYGAAGAQKTVSIRGSTASQVLVLVDGVRVSSAMSGSIDLSTIPADSIDHIEVLRGGASALYGSDAVGGVINIITKKKEAPLSILVENQSFFPVSHVEGYGVGATSAGPDYGSLLDSQKLSFSFSPAIGAVGLHASGGFTRAGNSYTFTDSSNETRIRQNAGLLAGNGAAGLSFPFLNGKIDADFTGSWQKNGVPGSLSSPTPSASQTDSRATAVLKFSSSKFFTDSLTLDVAAHAEYADVGYQDPDSGESSDSQLFTAGIELQQQAVASDAVTLVYGVSSEYDKGLSNEFGTPQRLSAGGFLAPIVDLGSFSVHPAIRYDFYSDYTPGALSGALGFEYRLTNEDFLKANLSSSFRVPSFEDLYWPSGSGVEGNPDLAPETAYAMDVGYERSQEGLLYSVFVFTRYARDVILWQTGSDGIWRPSNFGAALYPGLEQELKLTFLQNYSAAVDYTFLYSFVLDQGMSVADDKRLPMTPVHTLSVTMGYSDEAWSWSVTGRYMSLRYVAIANTSSLPAAFILDAIVKKSLLKHWSLYFAVDNLFNEQYQTVNDYPMPGTSFRAGITGSL